MSWTDSQIESLITFYSSMLVSGDRNFATGVKNRRPETDASFLAPVSGACVIGITAYFAPNNADRSTTVTNTFAFASSSRNVH